MGRLLTKEGFRVVTASSGEEGLRLAREMRPGAITLDVMMPGMDGWAVLSALKDDPALAEIPVVLVTMTDDRNMGYALGASEYLTKPIDPARLVNVLKKHTEVAQRASVLIVDDDPVMREMTARLLTGGRLGRHRGDGRPGRVGTAGRADALRDRPRPPDAGAGRTHVHHGASKQSGMARHSGRGRDGQGRHRRRSQPIERVCEDHPPQRRVPTKGTAARRPRAGQGVLAAGGIDLVEGTDVEDPLGRRQRDELGHALETPPARGVRDCHRQSTASEACRQPRQRRPI